MMEVNPTSKCCSTCGERKTLDDFYAHPKGLYGRLNRCKQCHKAAQIANRANKVEYYREYDRQRAFREDRVEARKGHLEKIKACPELKAKRNVQSRANAAKHPDNRKARVVVGNAIRDGILIRPDNCERCVQVIHTDAHHEDYSKPLDVVWLCEPCHGMRHREINAERRTSNPFDY